uniref:Pyrin domain-containing protein n=1 Tax=Chrysemys picta bellii TaxID=8478 RepID=A0A8C3HH08_CHRPI
MGKTVRDHLVDTLEELTQDGFKRFKTKLNVFPVKAGYSNIPRGQLEKADVLDVCDKLISFYLEKYAVEVTVEVLTAINERELADRLCKHWFRCRHLPQHWALPYQDSLVAT